MVANISEEHISFSSKVKCVDTLHVQILKFSDCEIFVCNVFCSTLKSHNSPKTSIAFSVSHYKLVAVFISIIMLFFVLTIHTPCSLTKYYASAATENPAYTKQNCTQFGTYANLRVLPLVTQNLTPFICQTLCSC
jgi:hypothetical protein